MQKIQHQILSQLFSSISETYITMIKKLYSMFFVIYVFLLFFQL
jgi:hypothetical protein